MFTVVVVKVSEEPQQWLRQAYVPFSSDFEECSRTYSELDMSKTRFGNKVGPADAQEWLLSHVSSQVRNFVTASSELVSPDVCCYLSTLIALPKSPVPWSSKYVDAE